jgi:hypothetical protein
MGEVDDWSIYIAKWDVTYKISNEEGFFKSMIGYIAY